MTTKCFLNGASSFSTPYYWSSGTNLATMDSAISGWETHRLSLSQGASLWSKAVSTGDGSPTNGLEAITQNASGLPVQWVSPPIDQDITISGTITFNVWMFESSMSANVGAQVVIERLGSTGLVVSTIVNSERGVELGTATAAQNWTAAPTSTDMKKGDRFRVRVCGNDIGSRGIGFTFTPSWNGATPGADGDSYVTFNETFGFLTTDPTTTTIYPSFTASDIDPGGAGTDTKEAWTTQGASGQTAIVDTVNGWTVPIQWTVSSGGNLIEWYTKPLTAFTLAAPVLVSLYLNNSAGSNETPRCELAVCATDGSSATVWGATTSSQLIFPTSGFVHAFYVSGADLAVTNGQRIRIRCFIDDQEGAAMISGRNDTLTYDAGGASDSWLIFGQTLTEFIAVGRFIRPFKPVPFIPRGRSI